MIEGWFTVTMQRNTIHVVLLLVLTGTQNYRMLWKGWQYDRICFGHVIVL